MTRRIPAWVFTAAALLVVFAAIIGAQWLTNGGLAGP